MLYASDCNFWASFNILCLEITRIIFVHLWICLSATSTSDRSSKHPSTSKHYIILQVVICIVSWNVSDIFPYLFNFIYLALKQYVEHSSCSFIIVLIHEFLNWIIIVFRRFSSYIIRTTFSWNSIHVCNNYTMPLSTLFKSKYYLLV